MKHLFYQGPQTSINRVRWVSHTMIKKLYFHSPSLPRDKRAPTPVHLHKVVPYHRGDANEPFPKHEKLKTK